MADPAPEGLFGSLRGLAASGVGLAQNRLRLLGVEWQEEQQRLLGLVLYGLAGVIALAAGVVFLAIAITVALWDSNRLLALGVFSALFLGGGTVCVLVAAGLARRGSRLFEASLAELRRDADELNPADGITRPNSPGA